MGYKNEAETNKEFRKLDPTCNVLTLDDFKKQLSLQVRKRDLSVYGEKVNLDEITDGMVKNEILGVVHWSVIQLANEMRALSYRNGRWFSFSGINHFYFLWRQYQEEKSKKEYAVKKELEYHQRQL